MNNYFVSIVIPVYRNSDALNNCLEGLHEQTYPAESFEVLVVNNEPENILDTRPYKGNIRVLSENKPGSYAARNKGIRDSEGTLLGFCDSDCIPCRDWIKNAVRFFRDNQDCTRLGGRIELSFSNINKPTVTELYESIFAFRQEEYVKQGTAVTANMFAYKSVFESIGFFDDNLMSGGDLVWGYRAQQAGFRIGYVRSALVRHPARKSFADLACKARRVVSGYMIINEADFAKNPVNALYHGICMIKPPVKALSLIYKDQRSSYFSKVLIYLLEYLLKIIQFAEYIRLQCGKIPER